MDKKTSIEVSQSFLPQTFAELREFVDIIAESDLVPKSHCTKDGKPKKGNLMACVVMGHSLGVPPMQAIQNICVINGMPSVWGDLALALAKTHPECVDVVEERIDNGWRCTSKRKGKADVVREFTYEDAKRADLLNRGGPDSPWKKYTDRMIQMRARGFSIRDQFPDALRGLKIAEEVIDVQAEVTTTDSPADRLRAAKSSAERVDEITTVDKIEEKAKDSDSDAVMVLDAIMSQLRELEYKFSDKELERLRQISTDEQVTKAIDFYEKKLIELQESRRSAEEQMEE